MADPLTISSISFSNRNTAKAVFPAQTDKIEDVAQALTLPVHQAVIGLIGSTANINMILVRQLRPLCQGKSQRRHPLARSIT